MAAVERSRKAIKLQQAVDPLARAIHFLHHRYDHTLFYAWGDRRDVQEAPARRLPLLCPPWLDGALYAATSISLAALVVQLLARPFARASDNLLATACSLSLTSLFICCMLLKVEQLIDDLGEEVAAKVKGDYDFSPEFIIGALSVSMLAALAVAAFIAGWQAAMDRRRHFRDQRYAMVHRAAVPQDGRRDPRAAD